MPSIVGELEIRTEIATGCVELREFSCGDGRLGAVEDEINELVHDLGEGAYPDAVLRVAREVPPGRLVGIAAVEPNKGPHIEQIPQDENRDAAYIVVVALAAGYRGRKTTRQGQPLGEVLLLDALQIIRAASGGTMPPVQGMIGNRNAPSRELVSQQGFVCAQRGIGASFYVRPRGRVLPGDPQSHPIDAGS